MPIHKALAVPIYKAKARFLECKTHLLTRKSNLIGYELAMYMEKSPYIQGEISNIWVVYKEKSKKSFYK